MNSSTTRSWTTPTRTHPPVKDGEVAAGAAEASLVDARSDDPHLDPDDSLVEDGGDPDPAAPARHRVTGADPSELPASELSVEDPVLDDDDVSDGRPILRGRSRRTDEADPGTSQRAARNGEATRRRFRWRRPPDSSGSEPSTPRAQDAEASPASPISAADIRAAITESLAAERDEITRLEAERLVLRHTADLLLAADVETATGESSGRPTESGSARRRDDGERLRQERLEVEQVEARQQAEAERLESERLESERLEAERLEAQRQREVDAPRRPSAPAAAAPKTEDAPSPPRAAASDWFARLRRADGRRLTADPSFRSAARWAITAITVVAVAALVRTFLVAPYFIPSASMEPTLHGCTGCNNDHVLVDKLAYHLHAVHRGDVVVFSKPTTWTVPDKLLIKRVIGLPGDVLTDQGGTIYVNGQRLDEPYIDADCVQGTTNLSRVVVPAHDIFVMGDNRCESADSRIFGPVPESELVGRAFLTIWPLSRIHWL